MNQQNGFSVALPRVVRPLYSPLGGEGNSMMQSISKEIAPGDAGRSGQSTLTGRRNHPFNFAALRELKDHNEHHSACISAKVSATVGIGHLTEHDKAKRDFVPGFDSVTGQELPPPRAPLYEESNADRVLSPLTSISWHDTLTDICEDFWDTGNGYLEVVQNNGTITGLHHLPSSDVYVVVEDDKHNFHYEICGEGGTLQKVFASFGDREGMIERLAIKGTVLPDGNNISEVIHFCQPSSRARWYGAPDWIAAVPLIELTQMLHQYKFDFFNNRGVPEYMLFIIGHQLDKKAREQIETSLKATIGLGNSHKSIMVNLPGKDVTVQLERLAMEGGSEEEFKSLKETLALSVVTAHKVPPLLAGIQISGKLGATNETSQALIAFQALVIGRAQRVFTSTMARTLGSPEAGLGLVPEDFALRTIVEDIDISKLDTVGKMKQPLPQAVKEGRDLDAGVKD